MDFGLSAEQTMLQDSVVGYLSSVCTLDAVRRAAESGDTNSREIKDGLIELGVGGLLIAEDYGGLEMGLLEAALISEAMGYVAAPIAFIGTHIMAPAALSMAGSEAQRERWLPDIVTGEVVVAIGFNEQVARRKGAGVSCDNGLLTGKAMFVIEGGDADVFLLSDNQGAMHLVLPENVQINKLKTIDRTRSLVEVVLSKVPADILPGSQGNLEPLLSTIDIGRVMLAADSLGAAQKMLDDSVAYAKERKQFGRVIGSFQAVKHMCAEMAAELEPCRSMVWYAAHTFAAEPQESRLIACHTKAHMSEVGEFVGRTATEVHGGMGMTDLLGLHYWFKRLGLNRQLLGGPEVVREEAAKVQGW